MTDEWLRYNECPRRLGSMYFRFSDVHSLFFWWWFPIFLSLLYRELLDDLNNSDVGVAFIG